MLKTTAGKLIVADALPDDMKDWAELSFNKKTLSAFMTELAQRHPDQYREVTHKLLQIARRGAMESGSNSFGLKHIRVSPIAKARREKLHSIIDKKLYRKWQRNSKKVPKQVYSSMPTNVFLKITRHQKNRSSRKSLMK